MIPPMRDVVKYLVVIVFSLLAVLAWIQPQTRGFIFGPFIIAASVSSWRSGVPWTRRTRITGKTGKVLALLGFAIGAGAILFGIAWCIPPVRHRIEQLDAASK
jgi:uncharacterized membrane protein YfcA